MRLPVRIDRHRGVNSDRGVASDISMSGLRIEPPVRGRVGDHVFVSAGTDMIRVEARIANQSPAGTGLKFIFEMPLDRVQTLVRLGPPPTAYFT